MTPTSRPERTSYNLRGEKRGDVGPCSRLSVAVELVTVDSEDTLDVGEEGGVEYSESGGERGGLETCVDGVGLEGVTCDVWGGVAAWRTSFDNLETGWVLRES